MLSLGFPLALLLLPLPLAALRWLAPSGVAGGAVQVPGSVARRFGAGGTGLSLARAANRVLPWVIWLLLVCALAEPRTVTQNEALPVSGRDITLVLDLSGSMERLDFEINGQPASRLDAVKQAALNFIARRDGDRIGLVIFADRAFYAAAPTYDLKSVAHGIEEATIGIAGRSTAIGDGLGLALKRLVKSDAKSKVIILLSDGANNAGSVNPVEVATFAKNLGIRIHSIALGQNDFEHTTDDPDAVDSATLRKVAEVSGGIAFRVKTTQDLDAVSAAIDKMETGAGKAPPAVVYSGLWVWPAAAAVPASLALAALELGALVQAAALWRRLQQ